MDKVVKSLREVGFSQYEARLYEALLRHGPQNGNELSRSSGVPSSKVYGIVEKLEDEGVVQTIRSDSGTRFVGLRPEELIDRIRRRFNEPLDFLGESLPALADHVPEEAFLTVAGEEVLLEAARQMVESAVGEINVSLWEPELEFLREGLEAAADRGTRVFGMLYAAEPAMPSGTWVRHSYEEIVGARVGGRMLTLVVDGAEALIGRFPDGAAAAGVRTRNPVLTLVASEYLHHDMVLQRAQINIGFDEWDKWWQADPDLRSTILRTAMQKPSAGAAPEGGGSSKSRSPKKPGRC
jgi:HTH-type transcriptional regulator, sugar sensing transcriptional regulator